jgi:DNA-binding LytR/AlgR family response regulator
MINCIIVEDQPPAQRLLKKYISETDGLELCGIFSDALSAMNFLNKISVDLIFLDIHLPKISGLNFISILSPRPLVVLTTAFPQYALESYELDVVDYLLKPFTFDRFFKAILKVRKLLGQTSSPAQNPQDAGDILIKEGYSYFRVKISAIIYLKSDGDYTFIVTSGKKYMTLNPLKYWLEQLPDNKFYQIHRSYVVNINCIEKVTGNFVELNENELKIPIGRVFKKEFMEIYLDRKNLS